MIGGYQIISLHNNNNAMGTSYSIKGLYKKVKKSIKQIKLEDLIVDGIKMENVFINVHLDDTKYIGTFGLYQITFNSDDTYVIEENSSGASGLYFVTSDSYTFSISSDLVSYDNYPNLKQLYLDQPSMFILTKAPFCRGGSYTFMAEYILFVKVNDSAYYSLPYTFGTDTSPRAYNIVLSLTKTGFIYNYV